MKINGLKFFTPQFFSTVLAVFLFSVSYVYTAGSVLINPAGNLRHASSSAGKHLVKVNGKVFLISSALPSAIGKRLANYLSSHEISNQIPSGIKKKNTAEIHIEDIYEPEEKYKTAPERYLGIWTHYLTPSQCLSLGFNEYFVDYERSIKKLNSKINSAHADGFDYSNIMVSLGTSDLHIAETIVKKSVDVGYYFIDEPVEHKVFRGSCKKIASLLSPLLYKKNPLARIMLSSYRMPEGNICGKAVGDKYLSLMEDNNNVCVQCDKYTSNCCGNVTDYWKGFQKYYGINRNFSNWINVTVNNGSTRGDFPCSIWPFPVSSGWSTLFVSAEKYGMKNIWLFADGTGTKKDVLDFCRSAFKNKWLLRKALKLVVVWKYEGIENKKAWPEGKWDINNIYYDGSYTWLNSGD